MNYDKAIYQDKLTDQDIVDILNTFDNGAEMSDDSRKGDKLYKVVDKVRQFLTKDNVGNIKPQLNDTGKYALNRYFRKIAESTTYSKLRKIIREEVRRALNEQPVPSEEVMWTNIQAFLDEFPDDATSWSQATDELRDLSKAARELTRSSVGVNFNMLKTPSDWNTTAKDYITRIWKRMSSEDKAEFYKEYEHWFDKNKG